MVKDWRTRLTETIRYIGQIPNLSPAHVAQLQPLSTQEWASALISLGGVHPFSSAQDTQRRHALRGLLLCLVWSAAQDAIPTATRHYQNASEDDLRDAIASFFPLVSGDANAAVAAALRADVPGGGDPITLANVFKYRRGATETSALVTHAACYESVNLWLYLGGVVSLRWLLAHGNQPGLLLPAQWIWGDPIDDPRAAAQIPAGQFCRFHRPPAGLHYTLSIGHGNCVGNHNSQDVSVQWLREYGPAPAPTISRFSIAGYLATTAKLAEDQMKRKPPAKELGLRTARCVPKQPF
jgi:hypothetical protein